MRVCFLTDGDYKRSPSARQWFFQMSEYLKEHGVDTSLNVLTEGEYDVAIIHWVRLDRIKQVLKHSPNAHIGVLNPGYLGYPKNYIKNKISKREIKNLQKVVKYVDFFIVTGFMWREILLPYQRRVYQTIDYSDLSNCSQKKHVGNNNLVIGYHGNEIHFKEDFFPHGANAIKKLANEFDFTLKIITHKVDKQPRIEAVHMDFVEFDVKTIEREMQTFDIGICPIFSNLEQLLNPYTYIRNPNRVLTLLKYGIPSVTSPVFQACNDLQFGENVFFAFTEEGWYQSLKKLIISPDLRNKIGENGRKMIEKKFSKKNAIQKFKEMLEKEFAAPLFPKSLL